VFPQQLILFSQPDQFFFDNHDRTLLGLTPFGKSPSEPGQLQLALVKVWYFSVSYTW